MQTNRPEQQLQQKTGPTETTHAFFHQQPSVLINTECNNVHKFYKQAPGIEKQWDAHRFTKSTACCSENLQFFFSPGTLLRMFSFFFMHGYQLPVVSCNKT